MTTFTVRGNTYELTDTIKGYFIAKYQTENTENIEFEDGGILVHEFVDAGITKTERVNLITNLEMFPDTTLSILRKLGVKNEKTIYYDESDTVSLADAT